MVQTATPVEQGKVAQAAAVSRGRVALLAGIWGLAAAVAGTLAWAMPAASGSREQLERIERSRSSVAQMKSDVRAQADRLAGIEVKIEAAEEQLDGLREALKSGAKRAGTLRKEIASIESEIASLEAIRAAAAAAPQSEPSGAAAPVPVVPPHPVAPLPDCRFDPGEGVTVCPG